MKWIFAAVCFFVVTESCLLAATVPAGTTLSVRTGHQISSHTRAGKHFKGTLAENVVVNGKIVLDANTPVVGVIEASRANARRSSDLTLDLTSIAVHGNSIPVKTTGGFQPEVPVKSSRQARYGFSVGETYFPPGTKLEFRLAQPLQFN